MDVAEKVWIVTGGASGLGAAVVSALVTRGGFVAVLDLNVEAGSKEEKQFGNTVAFFRCDVGDEESVKQALKGAKDRFEGKKWGGVVHCGGVGMAGKVRIASLC